MKPRDNKKLRTMIQGYESETHTHAMGMHMFGILGLISFGIMAVPIFTLPAHRASVAQVAPEATQKPLAHFAATPVRAHAALVYDLATNQTLYEQNATAQLPLASLTKLLTLYATASRVSGDSVVTLSEESLAQEGDSGFTAGEQFYVRDLERFALVASSNDAAQALSEEAQKRTAQNDQSLMASAATAAGLMNTRATNSTGLDISPSVSGGYGTARDVAILAGELLTLTPSVAKATTRDTVTITSLSGISHTLPNTNQSIGHIPNPLLSKTGLTDLAGGNLVIIFDVGLNHPIAIVVLGSTKEERFTDVQHLVDSTLAYFAPTQ